MNIAAKTLANALVITVILALGAGTALARSKGGVSMPNSKTIAGKKVVLNGMGIREATVFNVDVYVAGLYVESKSRDGKAIINSEQVKQITLKFVRDVDRSDIRKAWKEGLKKNSGKYFADVKKYIPKFNAWMPKFKEGDSLTFTYVPGTGLKVQVNSTTKGVIKDVFFARVLFSVFLHRAPNAGLKKGLLGR